MSTSTPRMSRAARFGLAGCVGAILMMFAAIGFFVYSVVQYTAPVRQAATAWLEIVGSGRISDAYAQTSPKFKEGTSPEKFTRIVYGSSLQRFSAANWSSTSSSGSAGQARGRILLRDMAQPLDVILHMVKDGDTWRLDRIEGDRIVEGPVPDAELAPKKSAPRSPNKG